jgi:hypothetical protein
MGGASRCSAWSERTPYPEREGAADQKPVRSVAGAEGGASEGVSVPSCQFFAP